MAVRTPRVSLLTLPRRSPRARRSRSPKLASKEPIASCFKVGNGETLEERCRPCATRWKIVVRSAVEFTHEPGGDHLSATKLAPVRSDGSTLARPRHPGAPVTLRMLGQGHRRTGNLRTGRGLKPASSYEAASAGTMPAKPIVGCTALSCALRRPLQWRGARRSA